MFNYINTRKSNKPLELYLNAIIYELKMKYMIIKINKNVERFSNNPKFNFVQTLERHIR